MANFSDFNSCTFVGRLPEDPRQTVTANDVEIANFAVLSNDVYTDKNGNTVEHLDRIHCVAFRGLAKVINEHARKGRKVLVTGRLRVDRVEADGEVKFYTKIRVNEFHFLDPKNSFQTQAPAEDIPDTVTEL